MTKKKPTRSKSRKKGSRKKSRKRGSSEFVLLKILTTLTVLVLFVVAAGFLTHYILIKTRPPIKRLPPLVKMRPQPTAGIRPFEVFPKEDRPPVVPLPKPKPPAEALPKVAIIIDDLGYDQRIAQKFLDLDAGLTFAVLPLAPHTRLIAATIFKKGGELMLHLPMEPLEYPSVDPGPGALLSSMSADDLIAQLRENLSDVPGIKGVNNHMGSKLTAESARLYQVFSVLKKEEGGRHTPFFNGYRPQFYFRTTDVTGASKLPQGTEMVMPGDNVNLEVELIAPIAMEKGVRFAIREGGRTVGAGTVTEIIE